MATALCANVKWRALLVETQLLPVKMRFVKFLTSNIACLLALYESWGFGASAEKV